MDASLGIEFGKLQPMAVLIPVCRRILQRLNCVLSLKFAGRAWGPQKGGVVLSLFFFLYCSFLFLYFFLFVIIFFFFFDFVSFLYFYGTFFPFFFSLFFLLIFLFYLYFLF
jgi:hypothetical protein